MAKKTFTKGIESMIQVQEEQQVNIITDNNLSVLVTTSINANPDQIKNFKISLLKNNLAVHQYFENAATSLINDNEIEIPHIEGKNNFVKYSFRVSKSAKDALKKYSIERDINLRDLFVFLINKQILG